MNLTLTLIVSRSIPETPRTATSFGEATFVDDVEKSGIKGRELAYVPHTAKQFDAPSTPTSYASSGHFENRVHVHVDRYVV